MEKDYLNLTEENKCKRYQWQNERSIVWQRLKAAIIQMFKQLIANHFETSEEERIVSTKEIEDIEIS